MKYIPNFGEDLSNVYFECVVFLPPEGASRRPKQLDARQQDGATTKSGSRQCPCRSRRNRHGTAGALGALNRPIDWAERSSLLACNDNTSGDNAGSCSGFVGGTSGGYKIGEAHPAGKRSLHVLV